MFSESPLNTYTDTRIIRALWHVPLVSVLPGFHRITFMVSEAIPIFSIILKVFFSLSDRYKIFTSNWSWIEICENVVLSRIDSTMTTINKQINKHNGKWKRRILRNLDPFVNLTCFRNYKSLFLNNKGCLKWERLPNFNGSPVNMRLRSAGPIDTQSRPGFKVHDLITCE